MKTKVIKLSDIAIDGGTQQRVFIDPSDVSEYAEALQCGAKFPPVTTFFDGASYWLVDGFHRYHAHRISDIVEILSEVHEGTQREAILYSASVNGTHGLRLTNADKRNAVMVLLEDDEWSHWSNRDIAKHCKVGHSLVDKLRKELNNELPTVGNTPSQPASNKESENQDSGNVAKNPTEQESIRKELYEEFNPVAELEQANIEIERITKIVESDEPLLAAMAEVKRLNALVLVLEERMRGFQSSENQAKKQAQFWKNKHDKLEKQMKASGLVEF